MRGNGCGNAQGVGNAASPWFGGTGFRRRQAHTELTAWRRGSCAPATVWKPRARGASVAKASFQVFGAGRHFWNFWSVPVDPHRIPPFWEVLHWLSPFLGWPRARVHSLLQPGEAGSSPLRREVPAVLGAPSRNVCVPPRPPPPSPGCCCAPGVGPSATGPGPAADGPGPRVDAAGLAARRIPCGGVKHGPTLGTGLVVGPPGSRLGHALCTPASRSIIWANALVKGCRAG